MIRIVLCGILFSSAACAASQPDVGKNGARNKVMPVIAAQANIANAPSDRDVAETDDLTFGEICGEVPEGETCVIEGKIKLDKPETPKAESEGESDEVMKARRADYAEAMQNVAERQKVFDDAPSRYSLSGKFAQGGLAFGQVMEEATVRLDGNDVMVGDDGRFVIGFGRDFAPTALLVVTYADGTAERQALEIEDREFPVQRIDGLDQSKVSGFTEEQLAKIGKDSAKKKAARAKTQSAADWAPGFDWPVTGRISGVFGSQRILNGEPKRPHSGVDVAAGTGTPVRAPAAGTITLAEHDMYFEGGLILLDHGHWLESAFLHLSRIDVEPGQYVEKGEIIGAVGATGRVTGPHLHWSMKWAGNLVDPQLAVPPMPEDAAKQ